MIWNPIAVLPLLAAAGLAQAPASSSPTALASAEKVEIRGTVERLDLNPGQGFPTMLVKTGPRSVRVQLGSFRFLLEQDFSPKAGADVIVKGYRLSEDFVVARAIELPADRKTIVFRAEDGTPLWRMGRYGKRGR
ncbi:MAG: hypothetical protein ACUVS7_04760 [Bryobacteraceae bacterium]